MISTLLYIYLTGWIVTGSYHAGKCVGNKSSRMSDTECKLFMGVASAGWPYYLIQGEP